MRHRARLIDFPDADSMVSFDRVYVAYKFLSLPMFCRLCTLRHEAFLRKWAAIMHELAIAQNILEIVQQSVPEDQAAAVRQVRIRVGQLSGIVPDSLDFCFSVLVNETNMQQASLAIEQVLTVSECRSCAHRFQIEDLAFICPACKGTDLNLISGKELEVVEIELEDESGEAL
jgi:hydrogenase nickel incorporation protein HypA/HybF